jgi:hypothetical protein
MAKCERGLAMGGDDSAGSGEAFSSDPGLTAFTTFADPDESNDRSRKTSA